MNSNWNSRIPNALLLGIISMLAAGLAIGFILLTHVDECTLKTKNKVIYRPDISLSEMHLQLKEHEYELKSYISGIKAEIEVKASRLAELDKELLVLESQYSQLIKKRESLSEQIEKMTNSGPADKTVHLND